MLEAIARALTYLADPLYWGVLVAGTILAVITGIVPGVGSVTVMALLIPFILFNITDPTIAIVFLAAITGVGNTLDSLPAILLGQPGSSTQVTFLEGHQLARQGKAAHTLGAVYAVSALGGLVGAAALALVIPAIRPFILQFSFGEIAVFALFGVAMVSILSRGAMIKGLLAGLAGLLLGTVGVDPVTSTERFMFGQRELIQGLPTVATIIGFFALPEMIDLSVSRESVAPEGSEVSMRELLRGARDGLKRWKVAIRQSLFGVFLGAIPGVGGSVIDWLAYAFGIALSRDRSSFGKGSLDGLLFAESAQNAKEGGQAIPTLALGIPGGTGWIMLIVAMMAYDISPGPEMLGRYAHITIAVVITLALANLIAVAMAFLGSAQLARLTNVPYPAIGAVIIPIVLISAFLNMLNWVAIAIAFAMAVVGLAMKYYGWPRPPLILGFILGPVIEGNVLSAISVHGPIGMLTRPVTVVMFILLVVFIVLLNRAMSRSQATQEAMSAVAARQDDEIAEALGPGAAEAAPAAVAAHTETRFVWRWSSLVPLAFVAVGAYAAWTALDFMPKARFLPMWVGIGMVVLGLVQLAMESRAKVSASGEIMDLGMRSTGVEGARRAAFVMLGLLVIYVAAAMALGLIWASIIFAVLTPVLLMEGPRRWGIGVVAGGLVAAFIFIVAVWLMNVIWPEPIIQTWLGLR